MERECGPFDTELVEEAGEALRQLHDTRGKEEREEARVASLARVLDLKEGTSNTRGRRAYVLVNNRAEGNAPLTVQGLVGMLGH